MIKHIADASGPGVAILYLVNHLVTTVVQPVLLFFTALAGLVWYGIRFYEYFKNNRID